MFGEIMADVSRLLRIPAASLNRGFYKRGRGVCEGNGVGWCSLRAGSGVGAVVCTLYPGGEWFCSVFDGIAWSVYTSHASCDGKMLGYYLSILLGHVTCKFTHDITTIFYPFLFYSTKTFSVVGNAIKMYKIALSYNPVLLFHKILSFCHIISIKIFKSTYLKQFLN